MTTEHYDTLEQAIRRVQAEYTEMTIQSYRERDLTMMRYRWDLLAKACDDDFIKLGNGAGVSGIPLYSYLDECHIDTALRRITGTR